MEIAAPPPHSLMATIWPSYLLALRRMARSRFFWAVLILSAVPVAIALIIAFEDRETSIAGASTQLEILTRTVYLHLVVFFIANTFGFVVSRQEFEDQTAHYLFLQPTPRWVLSLTRFASYVTLAGVMAVLSLLLTAAVVFLPGNSIPEIFVWLFEEGGILLIARKGFVLVLGLVIYGAFAMMVGAFLKSASYIFFLLLWEWLLPYLPQALKQWSALHYLQSLLPERPAQMRDFFEMLGQPASVSVSLTVIFSASCVFLAVATLIFQLRQCHYGNE